MKKKIFPIIFGRTGGDSINKMKDFEYNMHYIEDYKNLYSEIDKLKIKHIDTIFKIICNEKDNFKKKQLLNYKRDFYNNRNLKKYDNLLNDYSNINTEITIYKSKKEKINIIQKGIYDDFYSIIYKSIINIKNLTDEFYLKNGLLFSSAILFNEIKKGKLNFCDINGENKKIILSILKYITRSLTKTTPYSSFNSIFCLINNNKNYTPIKNLNKISNLQITNLFYYHLKEFLTNDLYFKNKLKVRCNSTIWNKNKVLNEFHYFENNRNIENFKKINVSKILIFIFNLLNKSEIRYNNLIDILMKESKEDEILVKEYIDILIKEGFIKIIYPSSLNEKNWIIILKNFLFQNELNNIYSDVVELLNNIIENIKIIENSYDADKRYQVILESYNEIKTFFNSRQYKSDFFEKVAIQDLYYEDTIISSNINIAVDKIEKLTLEIKNTYMSLNNIELKNSKKEFLSSFIPNNSKILILEFYEQIYLKNIENFILENHKIHNAIKFYSRIIVDMENNIELRESIDISIYTEDIKDQNLKNNFGVYLQANNNNFDSIVINNFSNGFGSNISRFLNSLTDDYALKVKKFNKSLYPNYLLCEIKDASIHNINTFPKLTEGLIHLSDDIIKNKTQKSISLSEVYIKKNVQGNIYLTYQDNILLKVNNLSLEGIHRRSKFSQFIELFNDVDNYGYYYLLENINNYNKKKIDLNNNIISIPRINFGPNIIIQRKKWFIRKEYLKSILDEKNKKIEEIFILINIFVNDNFIPKEVFFTISKRNQKNSQDDNYKPQYINFQSPIFILLLLQIINKADDIIEITEMYPTSQDVNQSGGLVTEYIFNCN